MAIWNGSLFFGRPHKGNLDLADQVVLGFVMKTTSKNKGNGIYADVSGNRPVEKPGYK